MDIYKFINSKDIREHCRKLNHKFNTLESAYLVHQSRKTIAEKHAAYREIIDTMPDMEFKRSNFVDVDYNSVHEFLREHIEAENQRLDEFKAKDNDSVYICEIIEDTGRIVRTVAYSNWKTCLNNSIDCRASMLSIKVEKQWINNSESKQRFTRMRMIALSFNCEKEPVKFDWPSAYDRYFDSLWIEVPTPFEKGDILYDPDGIKKGRPADEQPFVLAHICTWKNEKRLERKRRSADSSDMTAFGYFYNDATRLYEECVHQYLNLEYYPDCLFGLGGKPLEPISSFLKGEMDIALLVNNCITITREEVPYHYHRPYYGECVVSI